MAYAVWGLPFSNLEFSSGIFVVVSSLVHALYQGIKEGFKHGLHKLTGLVSHWDGHLGSSFYLENGDSEVYEMLDERIGKLEDSWKWDKNEI